MRENDLPTIARAARSAMRMVGALVLPEVMVGVAEASAGKHPCWIGAYPSRAAAGRVFSHDGNFTAAHPARRAVQEHDCAVVAKGRYRNRDLALGSSDIRESRSFDRPLTPIGVPGMAAHRRRIPESRRHYGPPKLVGVTLPWRQHGALVRRVWPVQFAQPRGEPHRKFGERTAKRHGKDPHNYEYCPDGVIRVASVICQRVRYDR